ncbi:threonine synthase [Herpetosiphon giganteus]|uniref:threonine synthase n=1 Tax=Herpetosiphon giganteus TaxID=2029754 RepID=UPI00195D5371|nr:threonine synthase [Herpetosiphon giganteus]MBM7842026.1 threonine synthase [Herpetosiphon giganteus]
MSQLTTHASAVPLLERYRQFLPITAQTPIVTLHEGNTPLINVPRLAAHLGVRELWLKLESMNPTGSFKDRGMVMAIAKALEAGSKAVVCASTGNTSAAAAAYAARMGMECVVVVPAGKIALGKLAQALMYGAKLLVIEGNFDQALDMVRVLADQHPITLVNSVNPYRLEGQATAAYEICDVLGDAPDYLALPVGNAGNISAYWMGFKRYYEAHRSESLPKILGFEATGSAAIVRGEPIAYPETVATAIRIGNPASWHLAVNARDESEGTIDHVSDEEILAAWRDLSALEGVFCEPASAAGVAGIRKLLASGSIDPNGRFVAVITGHGLKDPQLAVEQFSVPQAIPAELSAVVAALNL